MSDTSPVRDGSRITVEGLNPLVRALRRAEHQGALDLLQRANAEAAGAVHARAVPMVPIDSGRLLRTVRGSATPRQGVVRAGNRGRVPYAGVIHFGWPRRNISAQPFLTDALARTDVLGIFTKHIDVFIAELERHEADPEGGD